MNAITRRDLLKAGIAAGVAGAGLRAGNVEAASQTGSATPGPVAAAPIETVRIGLVGVGLQGGSHVENFLKIPGCRITAVCGGNDG